MTPFLGSSDWRVARATLALLVLGCGKAGHPSTGGGSGGAHGGSIGPGGGGTGGHASSGGSIGSGGVSAGGRAGTSAGGAGASGVSGGVSGGGGAGGAVPVALSLAKSGQRLKAMALVANGAEQFQYIQDSAFAEPCEFVQTADGRALLCVPTQQVSLIFLDAQCTQPVIAVGTQTQPPRNVTTEATRTYDCPGKFRPYRRSYKVGEPVQSSQIGTNPFAMGQDGRCFPTLGWGDRNGMFNVSPIADADLVSANREIILVGPELALSRINAADGAVFTTGVLTADGTACAIQENGACVPEPLAVVNGVESFLDAQCSLRSWASPYTMCDVPRYAVRTGSDGVHVFQVRRASAEYVPDYDPTTKVTTCNQRSNTIIDVFDLQAEVSGPFGKAQQQMTIGTGALRLELFVWPGANGTLIPLSVRQKPGEFLLAAGGSCQVREASDGTWRCASVDPLIWYNDGFADADCKQPLFLSLKSKRQEPAAAHPRAAATDKAGKIEAIHTLQAFLGQQQYFLSGTTCTPTQLTEFPGQVLEFWASTERTELAALPLVELEPL